ncbi:MAG: Maltodextrin ABC transporter, permease protein MdxG, partial [uncultured Quadrisphaera sp.]
ARDGSRGRAAGAHRALPRRHRGAPRMAARRGPDPAAGHGAGARRLHRGGVVHAGRGRRQRPGRARRGDRGELPADVDHGRPHPRPGQQPRGLGRGGGGVRAAGGGDRLRAGPLRLPGPPDGAAQPGGAPEHPGHPAPAADLRALLLGPDLPRHHRGRHPAGADDHLPDLRAAVLDLGDGHLPARAPAGAGGGRAARRVLAGGGAAPGGHPAELAGHHRRGGLRLPPRLERRALRLGDDAPGDPDRRRGAAGLRPGPGGRRAAALRAADGLGPGLRRAGGAALPGLPALPRRWPDRRRGQV